MNPIDLMHYLGRTITIKKMAGSSVPTLVEPQPDERDRRSQAATGRWRPMQSPREQPLEAIDVEVPLREQTILYYAMTESEQRVLTGRMEES